MTAFSHQAKTLQAKIVITGAVEIILYAIPFFIIDPFHENYTLLLNSAGKLLFYLSVVPSVLLQFFSLLQYWQEESRRKECILLLSLIIVCIALPYGEQENFLSSAHVLAGFICFLLIADLLFRMSFQEPWAAVVFQAGTFTAFLLVITFSSVNGLAEFVFGTTVALVLTICLSDRLTKKNCRNDSSCIIY